MADVTIQDVARAAGVSAASVSNLLNGRVDRMRHQTRARIEAVIASLGYKPNAAARQLKTGHVPMLGLLVPTVANPFFGELAVAVERAAQAQGYHLLLCNTLRDLAREREFAEELVAYGVRGLLTASALTDPAEILSLTRRGVSLVAFDVQRMDIVIDGIDVVTMDNRKATALAVDHLAKLGHSRIAYVTAPSGTISRAARLRGYKEALGRHGLGDGIVVIENTPQGEAAYGDTELAELGRRAAHRLVAEPRVPTAVIAVNDMCALGLISGLRETGRSVPDDMSVVGIDDIHLASLLAPKLTTIRQPLSAMADAAVGRLTARLADPASPAGEHVFEPELVIRDSTRPPASI